jgi:hypothetical protein
MTDDMGIIPEEELDEAELGGIGIEDEEIVDEAEEVIVDEGLDVAEDEEEHCDLEEHGHGEHAVVKRLCHDCVAEMEDDDDEVDYFGDEDDEARYYRNSTDEEADEF